jgi:hypothetical protein
LFGDSFAGVTAVERLANVALIESANIFFSPVKLGLVFRFFVKGVFFFYDLIWKL